MKTGRLVDSIRDHGVTGGEEATGMSATGTEELLSAAGTTMAIGATAAGGVMAESGRFFSQYPASAAFSSSETMQMSFNRMA